MPPLDRSALQSALRKELRRAIKEEKSGGPPRLWGCLFVAALMALACSVMWNVLTNDQRHQLLSTVGVGGSHHHVAALGGQTQQVARQAVSQGVSQASVVQSAASSQGDGVSMQSLTVYFKALTQASEAENDEVAKLALEPIGPTAFTWCKPAPFIEPPRTRNDLPAVLRPLKYTTFVEVGVGKGEYATHLLKHWPELKKYYMVDMYRFQPKKLGEDGTNVQQPEQDRNMAAAIKATHSWRDKVVLLRNDSLEATKHVPNGLDVVYLDANTDYCSVKKDMEAWWPKLRVGGILAGHDFLDNYEVQRSSPGQDWSKCPDGRHMPGAVRQAVNEFAIERRLRITVTSHDDPWVTWMIYKAECKGVEEAAKPQ